MTSANYRGSFASPPAFQGTGILEASVASPTASPVPIAASNRENFQEGQSALWFEAATSLATSVSEFEPLPALEPLSPDDEAPQIEPEEDQALLPKPPSPTPTANYFREFVFGVIGAIIILPVITAFATIIYKDHFFDEYFSALSRHLYLSCAVQQAVMSSKSTLPFAVGQVQDIGLVFMASIASSIVSKKLDDNPTDENKDFVIGGVIFVLSVGTLIVGVLIVVISALRLASLVQYVPLPVVGGYLGYLGYFLIVSGMFICVDLEFDGFESFSDLMGGDDKGIHSRPFKIAVGFALFIFLHLFVIKVDHPASLPGVLCAVPVIFYAILFASGSSIDEARDNGWLSGGSDSNSGSDKNAIDIWKLINISEAHHYFELIPDYLATIIPLFFLVAFGSSLDIAAIQQDYPTEIRYNQELATVGLQNIAAGLIGAGYTGSYIFSSTLFALKNGVKTKIAGCVMAIIELILFFVPLSPVEYIPRFYLGGLVIWIGYGIFVDWMIHSRKKVGLSEYVLIWATFFLVLAFELEYGLLLGAVLSMFVFIFSYASSNISEVQIIPSKQSAVKTVDQRAVLAKFQNNMVAVKMSGYIFFGSAVKIGKKLMEIGLAQRSKLAETLDDCDDAVKAAVIESPLILILDMRHLKGLDATAARTFGALRRSLAAEGIKLYITSLRSHQHNIHRLLKAHGGILADEVTDEISTGIFFGNTEAAVSNCEGIFLDVAVRKGLCRRGQVSLTLAEVLRSHLDSPRLFASIQYDYNSLALNISKFIKTGRFQNGDFIFKTGDDSNEVYIVKKGKICLETCVGSTRRKFLEYGAGGVFGDGGFYLGRPRWFDAVATDETAVWIISRENFDRMITAAPVLAVSLQLLIQRSSSLSAISVLQLLEQVQDEIAAGGVNSHSFSHPV